MSLFTIGDLHLPFSVEKPMDIFDGWQGYTEKLEQNWNKIVKPQDTVVIVGDISWAMRLEQSVADFAFINKLPGEKIILKGNHDYWWTSYKKMNDFFIGNAFNSIKLLHNNSYIVEETAIVGSRGWSFENGEEHSAKIVAREEVRLRSSLLSVNGKSEIIAFFHYPPISLHSVCNETLNLFSQFDVKKCYYGHLHGKQIKYALEGDIDGVYYKLVSADSLDFSPYKIK